MRVPNAPVDGLGGWGCLGAADAVVIAGERFGVCGWIAYDDEWVEYLLDDGRNPDVPTRFWSDELFAAARVFPADAGRVPVEVNTVDDPVLVDYTNRGWSSY